MNNFEFKTEYKASKKWKNYFPNSIKCLFCIGEPQPEACNFIKKETLAQVFFCEFCEISKNTFRYKTPSVADSEFSNSGTEKTSSEKTKNVLFKKKIKLKPIQQVDFFSESQQVLQIHMAN